jgi:hypothetical protein
MYHRFKGNNIMKKLVLIVLFCAIASNAALVLQKCTYESRLVDFKMKTGFWGLYIDNGSYPQRMVEMFFKNMCPAIIH